MTAEEDIVQTVQNNEGLQGNRTESSRLHNLVDHLNITHYQSKVWTDTFSDEHLVHKYTFNLFTKQTFLFILF